MIFSIKSLKKILNASFVSHALLFSLYANETEKAFTYIYDYKVWGSNEQGNGTSGPGSLIETTKEYRAYLQQFLDHYQIRSVVDIGCGDWQFSRTINWNNIQYIGYDVVKSVIETNQRKFQKPNILFIHGDVSQLDLPPADLLICKDVLQHLPHQDIFQILSQFHKFKYCLITNDVDSQTLSSANDQIDKGGYRSLDLSKPPFNLKGIKILNYTPMPGVTKQVFFISRSLKNRNRH